MYDIGIVPCENYDRGLVKERLLEVLTAVGGLEQIRPGMKVAVKANLVSAAAPEKAVVTHPVLLSALTELLIERGASVVVGDSPGGPFTENYLKRVYTVSDMHLVEEAGGTLNHDFSQENAAFPEGKILKQLTYTGWLKDADAIICFCKLKTHGMMGLSANVKNMFGSIPGTMKPEYHYRFPKHEDFANMLVDLNLFLKPCLYITDAVMGMEGNGPTSGTPRYIGALLASRQPFDLDVVCSRLIDLDPMRVPTIAAARERGLCRLSLKKMNIYGDPENYVVSDYQRIEHPRTITFSEKYPAFLTPLVKAVLQAKPAVKKKDCIGCKKCYDICPARAITMVERKPVIDREKCIRCFCCQEFCPKGAMQVHRSPLARALQHQRK